MRLEDLQPRCTVRGVHPDEAVEVVNVRWQGSDAVELTYKKLDGVVAAELLYREDEPRLELVEQGRAWSFDGDGALFRLVSEAQRIRLTRPPSGTAMKRRSREFLAVRSERLC